MKAKTMNLSDLQGKLSREEMKNVMAGNSGDESDGGDKPCQEHGDDCTTAHQLNCCNGLVCADYKCHYPTI